MSSTHVTQLIPGLEKEDPFQNIFLVSSDRGSYALIQALPLPETLFTEPSKIGVVQKWDPSSRIDGYRVFTKIMKWFESQGCESFSFIGDSDPTVFLESLRHLRILEKLLKRDKERQRTQSPSNFIQGFIHLLKDIRKRGRILFRLSELIVLMEHRSSGTPSLLAKEVFKDIIRNISPMENIPTHLFLMLERRFPVIRTLDAEKQKAFYEHSVFRQYCHLMEDISPEDLTIKDFETLKYISCLEGSSGEIIRNLFARWTPEITEKVLGKPLPQLI